MFGLFSSLIATKLQMLKANNVKNFFKIFKIRYALISFGILGFIFVDHLIYNFFENNINLKK